MKNNFDKISFAIILAFLSSVAVQIVSHATEPSPSQEVSELMAGGNFSYALKFVNEKIKQNPNNAELYVARGAVYARAKKNALSMLDQNKALEIFDTYPAQYNSVSKSNALHNRATLFNRMGKKYEAERDYLEAIKLFPSNSISFFELGKMQLKQKRYSEAKENLAKARELFMKQSNQEDIKEVDKLMPLVDKALSK
ncbi:MAG: hypothetical protein KIT34_15525 [Cyanobacteria bacterium TGS_CYA1]|nr:hypothetical protein [Cyanobacteria bacterium TGS_CYA1]